MVKAVSVSTNMVPPLSLSEEAERDPLGDVSHRPHYKRILLKLSGEALMGDKGFGIDTHVLDRLSDEIATVHSLGVQVCLVVGGGNIFRGVSGAAEGMNRTTADYMGMLGTVMNALALQSALEGRHVKTRVMSAIPMDKVCESYICRNALGYLNKGNVVIFAAGIGNPYFTTDTAAALRASEMHCDVLLKGTQVDGVYSADPQKNSDAVRYDFLNYTEVLAKDLKVMDAPAIALARENKIPILVFSIHTPHALAETICGRGLFTTISSQNASPEKF